jgi:sugar lactone lactonase YvrE
MEGCLHTVVTGLGFVEGVRWHEGRVWFSDFGQRRVYSADQHGELREEAWVAGQPSGLGFAPDGSLLVVSAHDALILRVAHGQQTVFADVGAVYRGGLNDMLTTPNGRCYVSVFPPAVANKPSPYIPPDGGAVPLLLVDLSGSVRVVADGLRIPNGIAISADGSTLLVAETLANRISAFDVLADGSLGPRRTYVDLGHRNPDGIALDHRGRLWIGCPYTSEFIRVDGVGVIDAVIEVPNRWAVTCAVGDSDEELWCAVVDTSNEQYRQGRAHGAIHRWQG